MISVIMGSKSDWEVMKIAVDTLNDFDVKNEYKIVSAHRTPKLLYEYAENAKKREIKLIIAGAGGSAHLPGMVASLTTIPVLGVPISSKLLGIDSLLSICQMPEGIPVATFAINGAKNAALYAISILAINDFSLSERLDIFRKEQTEKVIKNEL